MFNFGEIVEFGLFGYDYFIIIIIICMIFVIKDSLVMCFSSRFI